MRTTLLSTALAVASLTIAATPQAEASWLSQALRGNSGYYRAPYGAYGQSPVYGNGYGGYQRGYGYGSGYGGYRSGYSGYYSPQYAAPYQYQTPYTYQRGYYQSAPYGYGAPQGYPRGSYYQGSAGRLRSKSSSSTRTCPTPTRPDGGRTTRRPRGRPKRPRGSPGGRSWAR